MEVLTYWFLAGAGYLLGHFLLYALGLRFLRSFRQEKIIFGYHFFSCALVGVLLLGSLFFFSLKEALALMVALSSLHGIYSISFLELWSLVQGGYSLKILLQLKKQNEGVSGDFQNLDDLGKTKVDARVGNLQNLGLVVLDSGRYSLTWKGQAAAVFLKMIVFVAASKRLETAKG